MWFITLAGPVFATLCVLVRERLPAPTAAALGSGGSRVPRWVGVLGVVALAEQLIETITVFGDDGFIAPGGPMNAYVGALLFAIWLLCLAVTLSRTREDARPTAS